MSLPICHRATARYANSAACRVWNSGPVQGHRRGPERGDAGPLTTEWNSVRYPDRLRPNALASARSAPRRASAFVCVFSGSQSHARFDDLARDLRRTLTRHLDRVFAEAFPRLPKDDRSRMLAAWSDITGVMIASLDRSKPGERGNLLEELKTVLCVYLDAKWRRWAEVLAGL